MLFPAAFLVVFVVLGVFRIFPSFVVAGILLARLLELLVIFVFEAVGEKDYGYARRLVGLSKVAP